MINLKNYIFYVPKELRESMPVEGIDTLASLTLTDTEYPVKQEFNLSEGNQWFH